MLKYQHTIFATAARLAACHARFLRRSAFAHTARPRTIKIRAQIGQFAAPMQQNGRPAKWWYRRRIRPAASAGEYGYCLRDPCPVQPNATDFICLGNAPHCEPRHFAYKKAATEHTISMARHWARPKNLRQAFALQRHAPFARAARW